MAKAWADYQSRYQQEIGGYKGTAKRLLAGLRPQLSDLGLGAISEGFEQLFENGRLRTPGTPRAVGMGVAIGVWVGKAARFESNVWSLIQKALELNADYTGAVENCNRQTYYPSIR